MFTSVAKSSSAYQNMSGFRAKQQAWACVKLYNIFYLICLILHKEHLDVNPYLFKFTCTKSAGNTVALQREGPGFESSTQFSVII